MTEASKNPLIKGTPRDTIQAIKDYLGHLVDMKAQDPDAHPGEVLSLQVVLAGVESLEEKK